MDGIRFLDHKKKGGGGSSKKCTSVYIYFHTELNQHFGNFPLCSFFFHEALLTWVIFPTISAILLRYANKYTYSLFNRNIYYTHWQPTMYEKRNLNGRQSHFAILEGRCHSRQTTFAQASSYCTAFGEQISWYSVHESIPKVPALASKTEKGK